MTTESVNTEIACIFLAQQDFVKGLALYYAPWPGIADDVVQQVFLEFIAKQDRWKIQDDVQPLLAAMTRNVARRFWKEKKRSMPEALQRLAQKLEISEFDDQEEVAGERYEEKRLFLNKCLDQLPPKSRKLIDLRYFGPMTPTQIAELLHLKTASVNQSLYRLREKLYLCVDRLMKGGERDG